MSSAKCRLLCLGLNALIANKAPYWKVWQSLKTCQIGRRRSDSAAGHLTNIRMIVKI